MLKIILIIAAVIAAVAAGVLIYAWTRPDTFRVQRVQTIKAPPEKIFALINDFRSWATWSPYEKLDPGMKRVYGAKTAGIGATYEWDGNSKVGAGRMEIIEATAPSMLRIKLDFIKPFEGHNVAEFIVRTAVDSTEVTWAMHGPSPFAMKAMGIFMNMDHLIGKDFETGLVNLKAAAEGR